MDYEEIRELVVVFLVCSLVLCVVWMIVKSIFRWLFGGKSNQIVVKEVKFKEEKEACLNFATILSYKQAQTCVLMARIGELQSNPLTCLIGGFSWSELFSKSYPSDYVFIAELSPNEKIIVNRRVCCVYLNIDEKVQSLLEESNGFYLK